MHYFTIWLHGYSIALLVVGLIAAALAWFCWTRRPALGAQVMAWIMLGVAIWAVAYALELASFTLEAMLFWVRIEYLGIATVPTLWLLFVLQYSGYTRYLTRPLFLLLFVIPIITLILNYTNAWHYLYYASVGIDDSGSFPVLAIEKGIWYWVNAAYAYVVSLTASFLLFRHVFYSPPLYRSQTLALIIAALVPVASNVFYQLGLTPVAYLDLTPFAFMVTGLATTWGLYNLRLLDMTPIARARVIENLRDGMVVLDTQGRMIDVNPAATRYLALETTVIGQPVQMVRSRWSGLAEFCAPKTAARAEIVLEQEPLLYLEIQQSPFMDDRGDYLGCIVTLRDITERKVAENALQARQVAESAYLAIQQIVDTVEEGLVVLDPTQRVVMTNRMGQVHLALLAQMDNDARMIALGGRSLPELLSPPAGLPYHSITLPQPASAQFEAQFEVEVHLLQPQAFLGGWLLVTRDVTRIRQIQQQVEQQGRLAAVGQLAAGIAHDFNNILTVIELYTGLLQHTSNLAPKQSNHLETIRHQVQHATHLVQQILDYGRRTIIERTVLDLAPLLQEFVELCRRTLPETITIELHHAPGDYRCSVDPGRLQQALMNLAINARDAMPNGGTLQLHLAHLQRDSNVVLRLPKLATGEWLVVQMRDSGIGIDFANLPHIFEPFFTTKEPNQGTGLGLAQVFGIVKQHGGEIEVESQLENQPGQGTTISLYLPAASATYPLISNSSAASSPVATPPTLTYGHKTILAVEDENATLDAPDLAAA